MRSIWAAGALAWVTGCAATPCLQMPADGQPVQFDFGEGITLSVEGVFLRESEKNPFALIGSLNHRTTRLWRRFELEADVRRHVN
jgi:hypothetical protein